MFLAIRASCSLAVRAQMFVVCRQSRIVFSSNLVSLKIGEEFCDQKYRCVPQIEFSLKNRMMDFLHKTKMLKESSHEAIPDNEIRTTFLRSVFDGADTKGNWTPPHKQMRDRHIMEESQLTLTQLSQETQVISCHM